MRRALEKTCPRNTRTRSMAASRGNVVRIWGMEPLLAKFVGECNYRIYDLKAKRYVRVYASTNSWGSFCPARPVDLG
jgi:hypothetical protein